MKAVFADAFYFVACLNRADQHHAKAISFASQFTGRIVTTDWVLMEVAEALAASANRGKVVPFFSLLRTDPNVLLLSGQPLLFERGLALYHQRADKAWTLTDCISFVVMELHSLTEALTGDHHFEQAGFRAMLK